MRAIPIDDRPLRYDSSWVDRIVGHVVVAFDMIEVHRIAEARALVEVTRIAPQVGVVNDPP